MLQFCKMFWGHAPRPHSGIDQGPVPERRNNSIPGINVLVLGITLSPELLLFLKEGITL